MSKQDKTKPAAPAPAPAKPPRDAKQPGWVATTPLRYDGQRIEAGAEVPGLTADQAAELGDLVRPADAAAQDDTGDAGAQANPTEE